MSADELTVQPHMLDDLAVLDDTIQPLGPVDFAAEPTAIFLTGVTGFVGAFLLQELLATTQAVVYCLVRAANSDAAMGRIRANLNDYALWNEALAPRIIPVVGDLKLPRFGLSAADFDDLTRTIDVVFHCGSKLSYVAPYAYLKAANVDGTVETLRLATTHRPKAYHYVSSLGILLAYTKLSGGREDDELDAAMCPEIGYFQSKYVSERIVRMARDRGVPVTIHRIGQIVGDSRTGRSNSDDFVSRVLVGSILAGYAPDMHTAMDMTPVDYISAAMVYLSRQPSSVGKVFHLLNPHPIHWSDIFDMTAEIGYPVTKLPFDDWVEALEEHADRETNPLVNLLPFFHVPFARRILGIGADSHYHALGTSQALGGLMGSGIACPEINQRVISLFLNQFAAEGRLPFPAPVSVSAWQSYASQ